MAEVLYYAISFFVQRSRDKLGVLFHGPGWTPPGVAPMQMESNTRG